MQFLLYCRRHWVYSCRDEFLCRLAEVAGRNKSVDAASYVFQLLFLVIGYFCGAGQAGFPGGRGGPQGVNDIDEAAGAERKQPLGEDAARLGAPALAAPWQRGKDVA